MGFIKDMKEVLVPKNITLREVRKEDNEIYSFIFEPDKPLDWNAGKHAMFMITHKKIKKGTRVFSIASSPLEKNIMITTRIGDQPSEYKQALSELKTGMKMALRGPMGEFYAQPSKPMCFITGGIGITPVRSMIKDLVMRNTNFNGKVNLIYINSTGKFIFEEELKSFAEHDNIQVDLFTDKESFTEKIKEITGGSRQTIYFLSGSRQMTASVKNLLIGQSVSKKNIKADTFFGY